MLTANALDHLASASNFTGHSGQSVVRLLADVEAEGVLVDTLNFGGTIWVFEHPALGVVGYTKRDGGPALWRMQGPAQR